MKVIRYRKDKVEHYFDYDGIIHMLKENGRALFHVCNRIPTGNKMDKIKWETTDIEITADKLLLDDTFEILHFPFTSTEYLRLSAENGDYELSNKIVTYLLELKMIEHKMGKRV